MVPIETKAKHIQSPHICEAFFVVIRGQIIELGVVKSIW